MSEPGSESPLFHLAGDHGARLPGATISERRGFGHIDLRGRPTNQSLMAEIRQATSLELPTQANTVAHSTEASAFWLGPDQWLLLVPQREEIALVGQLRDQVDGHHAATVISSGQTVISVQGPRAAEIIRAGCPYDLERLGDRHCAQTIVAKAQVLLWQSEPARFDLVVRRSFAEYLFRWLCDGARDA